MTKCALLSVSDKRGLSGCARGLKERGYELLATGGTQRFLEAEGIPMTPVERATGFPSCFGGRVKTLHPLIAGGILFRRDEPGDREEARRLGILPIDVVVVNLYPFDAEVTETTPDADAAELIDIGGSTLLRAAAKNWSAVTVLCDPDDYDRALTALGRSDADALALRRALGAKAFLHTAAYDGRIAAHFGAGTPLRYGENPHQRGWFAATDSADGTWGGVLQGKAMSYLNILDADAAWGAVCDFAQPTAVFVKHCNPSGIASAPAIEDAFRRAYDADRRSAFGVIIALNRPCTAAIVRAMLDEKMFVEVLIAPDYEPEALVLLAQRENLRVIQQARKPGPRDLQFRSVLGGVLAQDPDARLVTAAELRCVTRKEPTRAQIEDLLFAWTVVKHCRSNAIVEAKDSVTVGIGCGQTSRVESVWIAGKRAGAKAQGAVLASDAFFPFSDALEEAAAAGIAAIIQPGGSIRDAEVIRRADELGLAMVLTGVRAFRH